MYRRHIITAALAALVLAVLPALTRAQDPETATPSNRSSQSQRGWLGITAESTSQGAEHEGAIVRQVAPNSPAAKAGLKRGDIVTKVDNRAISDFEDLLNALSQHKSGQKVNLQVIHNGQQKQTTITLGQRPNQFAEGSESGQFEGEQRGQLGQSGDGQRGQPGQYEGGQRGLFGQSERGQFQQGQERGTQGYYGRRRGTAFLGVQTEELTSDMRNREGISARQGAVVVEVMPNTPAAEAGLREGDVITKVDDEAIANPEDLREAIQNAGPGHEVSLDVVRGRRHRELSARLESGGAEFNQQQYGSADQYREIQRLEQRIQQLERRLRRLEQNRQSQSGY
jgi:S1-C subfamily serine protease